MLMDEIVRDTAANVTVTLGLSLARVHDPQCLADAVI